MTGKFALLFLFFAAGTQNLLAQSLRLRNTHTQAIVTGDTVMVQARDNNGWKGYESLDLFITVENLSGSNVEVGAKKLEPTPLQANVDHTICFAGNCYNTGTFVSPMHVWLAPGMQDSSFSGHYMFDNQVHVRGPAIVMYVFYDVIHPSDSAVVYVNYNTIISNLHAPAINESIVRLWPNPASERIYFDCPDQAENITVGVYDAHGREVLKTDFAAGSTDAGLDVSQLPAGVYTCFFSTPHMPPGSQRFVRR